MAGRRYRSATPARTRAPMVEHAAFPRVAALAEVLWSPVVTHDRPDAVAVHSLESADLLQRSSDALTPCRGTLRLRLEDDMPIWVSCVPRRRLVRSVLDLRTCAARRHRGHVDHGRPGALHLPIGQGHRERRLPRCCPVARRAIAEEAPRLRRAAAHAIAADRCARHERNHRAAGL